MSKLHAAIVAAAICATVLFPSAAVADDLRDALDLALSSRDTPKILSIMKDHKAPSDQAELVRWLKDKVDSGQAPDQFASFLILTSFSEKNFDDVLFYLGYYRTLIVVDGATCADPSSPGSLLESTIFIFGRLLKDQKFTLDQKQGAVDRAIKLEQATSPTRRRDPSLCGAGLTRYAKDLHLQLPTPAKPQESTGLYNDDADWRQKRSAALPNLKALLLSTLGVPEKQ
jgi:hypothetical protein